MKRCKNPECRTTFSIAETVEHGWGELDRNGFFEYPCGVCMRDQYLAPDIHRIYGDSDTITVPRVLLEALVIDGGIDKPREFLRNLYGVSR